MSSTMLVPHFTASCDYAAAASIGLSFSLDKKLTEPEEIHRAWRCWGHETDCHWVQWYGDKMEFNGHEWGLMMLNDV